MTRLEISRGRGHRHLLRRTAIGLVVGAGLGAFVGGMRDPRGCSAGEACYQDIITGDYMSPTPDHYGRTGAVVGGAVGTVLGGLAGLRPVEKWQRLSLEGQEVRIGASSRNGGSVAVALAF